jgi:peptide/nickel transport system permease protein
MLSARLVFERVVRLVSVLSFVLFASFLFLHLIPGDPVTIRLGEHADARQTASLRAELGLDKPWFEQIGMYVVRALYGDFGVSIADARPVTEKIAEAFPATVELALSALLFACILGIPIGIHAAVRQHTWSAGFTAGSTMLAVSVPVFWLGWMLIYVFAVFPEHYGLDLFPISGRISPRYVIPTRTHMLVLDALSAGNPAAAADALWHLVLPAVTLGTIPLAVIVKITRGAVLDALGAPYVRTARAKGLAEQDVLLQHVLRNALIPLLTVVGLQTGMLLGGAVLTEHIFAWPGVGRLAFDAISDRDVPLINGCILLFAVVFVIINALVDFCYALVDPRIREGLS